MTTPLLLIGCGQMGSSIVRGLTTQPDSTFDLYFCDARESVAQSLATELSGEVVTAPQLLKEPDTSDMPDGPRVFLIAVKPHHVEDVLMSIAYRADDIVISVAAGLTLESLTGWVGRDDVHIVRTMPNTPCLVGAGVTGIFSRSTHAKALAHRLFSAVGSVVMLERESHFHGLTAISGSGPAYIFLMLEALADGGVLAGLDRATARKLAVETFAGAAALVKSSPEVHTAELKDRVASPGGTTIAALRELERHGVRDALISAVDAAARRSKEMGS